MTVQSVVIIMLLMYGVTTICNPMTKYTSFRVRNLPYTSYLFTHLLFFTNCYFGLFQPLSKRNDEEDFTYLYLYIIYLLYYV